VVGRKDMPWLVSRPVGFSVDLTGLGLQVLVGIGYCA